MTRYILDTHALVWFLTDDDRLDERVREAVSLCEGNFMICSVSLIEIAQLQSLGKIKLSKSISTIIVELERLSIGVFFVQADMLEKMKYLPLIREKGNVHSDPFDRVIIATGIVSKCTVVSADSRFPFYRSAGLKLREI